MPSAGDRELKSVYNGIADSYDKANSIISFYQDRQWRKELAEMVLSVAIPKNVLDVGAGKGELSKTCDILSR